jgi:AmiR/NasT family two-component response regulator
MKFHRRLKVLLVDDDSLVIDVVQSELEAIGHEVIGRASDGRQAISRIRALQPDIVVMDITMPEMDGLEATRLIQEICPRPVVLLTAHDDPELVERASEAGAGAYILKPPNGPEMGRTLMIAIARFADFMELRRLNEELNSALKEVRTLKGLLPICAGCKKIRDENNVWSEIETYISSRADATFTHTLCPKCMNAFFPGCGPKRTP